MRVPNGRRIFQYKVNHGFIDVAFDRWRALMEVSMEKCFDFSSFAGNLINTVIPVQMVIMHAIITPILAL